MPAPQEEIYINCGRDPAAQLARLLSLIQILSGEAYLTQIPFFQGLYDLPGVGATNPNYDLDLLGDYAVTRCKLPHFSQQRSPLI